MDKLNLEFQYLKGYAAFLKEKQLIEFTKAVLENSRKLNIPLLSFFNKLDEEQILNLAIDGVNNLLNLISSGTIVQSIHENIKNWKENKIPNIPRESVLAKDITLINNARKQAFFSFLPSYTTDFQIGLSIVKEIENFYSFNETLAIDAYAEIKQEEIREREKQLKNAQSLAKLGNWKYNPLTAEIEWSEELFQIYGLPPTHTLKVEDLVPYIFTEDICFLRETIKRASITPHTQFTHEYRITRSSGEVRIIYEIGNSEVDKHGQTIVTGTSQDITEFRKIESELRENEKKFRLLAEQSSDMISINSVDGTILYISPSSYSLLGYKPEELIGTSAYELYHPEDFKTMNEAYDEISKIPDHYTVTFRCRKKSGEYIWFESIGKTIKDDFGNPIEIHATNRDITERKLSEQKIKENEELLSGVLNTSLSGIQVLKSVRDAHGKVIDFEWILANNAIENFFDFKKEELVGKRLLKVFPNVVNEGLFDLYVESVNGEPKNFRQFYNQNNSQHWFNLQIVPFRDGFILSSEDITAQIMAEQALKKINSELEDKVKERTFQLEKQREDLFSIFMQAPVPFAVLKGEDLEFELVNEQYLQLLGKTSEIIGKPGRIAVPEVVSQGLWELLENVFSTGYPYSGHEFPILVNKNNNDLLDLAYFNFVATPINDPDGNVSRLMLVAVEVTKQVLARQELKASEENLKTILEALPEIAWTATADGKVNYYNSRWIQFAGANMTWDLAIHPEELEETELNWSKAIENGNIYNKENRFKSKNGQYKWFLVRGVPVKDYHGKVEMWVGTCTDIHENKIIREQLAEINEELLIKNKELTRINIDLDNFIYTASHDLKAPVSNIEGLVATLKDIRRSVKVADEEEMVVMDMIETSITRFKSTIQDLTEISKIQKNFYTDIEDIEIKAIIEEVLDTIQEPIKLTNAEISINLDSCKTIKFSKINLKSILYNLISNAIKYRAEDRNPTVNVRCNKFDDYCIITVEDNGLGIKDEYLDKVFSMFKRFHDHVEGTGVGLYIVKRIVENAGGKIKVESIEGVGSKFTVYLKN